MRLKLEPVDNVVPKLPSEKQATWGSSDSESTQKPSRKKARLDPDLSNDALSREGVRNIKEEVNEDDKVVVKIEYEDIKIKSEKALSDNVLVNRLSEITSPPFQIGLPDDILKLAVPREFISSIYGGNPQETFPLIGKRFVDQHGLNDFMYPNLDYNPAAPRVPGSPGLFFKTTPEREDKKMTNHDLSVYRVITRLGTGKWLYMGQYSLTETRPLTVSEWAEQKPVFHNTWCREICEKIYGQKVLKRMAARKRFKCKEPTEDQLFPIGESGEWRGKFTPDDVQRAFARGEEKFAIYQVVCCGYDIGFQKNLYERFKTWNPPARKSKKTKDKKAGEKSKAATKSEKVVKVGTKRKRV